MASQDVTGSQTRPTVHTTRSFSRYESQEDKSPSRARANTVHTPTITLVPEARQISLSPAEEGHETTGDVFDEDPQVVRDIPGLPARVAPQVDSLEQLPIELRTFTERFLRSLSVKSHAAPLSIETIAELFQDFYFQAESHISTHIAALTTRLSRDSLREKSSANSLSTRTSISSRGARRGSGNDGGEQQMLTASEITGKKKARKRLEQQRVALEEAVERGVCEKVYDKIYRHRSGDDEEKDAKLRSKTAALSLVGIGLKELNVNIPGSDTQDSGNTRDVQAEVYERLGSARAALQQMDKERYPLGKLHYLTVAHQSIVETLAHVFPSTSSADEVLPTLIYTLITSPPESLNVVSNLRFIQLFRASAKVDGEAAYCLVNLEAAISFLETVDLSSLQNGETDSREASASIPPPLEHDLISKSLTADLPAVSNPDQQKGDQASSTVPPPRSTRAFQSNQRRISHLLQAQAVKIEASRETFINSADQAFDSINSTLENSFKFLFGRLKEQERESSNSAVIIPKTLDDARRLVKSPIQEEGDEDVLVDDNSIAAKVSEDPLTQQDDKLLGMVAGRRAPREPSTDGTKPGSSNKRLSLFGAEDKGGQGPADAVGNFVNALNPLSRFGVGVPSFPKFGRNTSGQAADTSVAEKPLPSPTAQQRLRSTIGPPPNEEEDLNAMEALAHLRKAKPPIKRFMEVKDVRDLKIGDVEDLLKDYRRLAELLGAAITS